MTSYHLFFDGGCIPNPNGTASLGLHCPELDIYHHEVVGDGEGMTNNIAEWSAVRKGIQMIKEHLKDHDTLDIMGDSELVIKQMKGEYRVKKLHLKKISDPTMDMIKDLKSRSIEVNFVWIPRKKNTIADRLAFESLKDHYVKKGYPICDCGGVMIIKKGPFGKFWGCCHYPKCNRTRKYDQ